MKLFNKNRFHMPPVFSQGRQDVLLLPAKPWFVLVSLALAFFFNLLPWSTFWLVLRPDFFALTLLYWCIRQPRWVGIGIAWVCGLLMDVVEANLFGQHALAYSILAFAAGYFYRRVLRFPLWPQAVHVLGLLLIVQAVVIILRLMSGGVSPHPSIVVASFSGALMWPVLSTLLQYPQRPKESD
jgi:rod shape-determining protein MreD